MKMTLDLPDQLVKQIKLRALHEGQKLKDAVADLLRKGLHTVVDVDREAQTPAVLKDKKTGLPVVQCKRAASAPDELTPDRVSDILLAQEMDWHYAAGR